MAKVFRQRLSWRTVWLIACETALIVSAVILAAWFRLEAGAWELLSTGTGIAKVALIAAVCQVCLYLSDLYDLRVVGDRRELVVRALQSLGAASLVLAVLYFLFPQLVLGRGVFFIASSLVVLIIVGWRLLFEWGAKRARPAERLLLVGTSGPAVDLAAELHDRRREFGVEIVGFVDPDATLVGRTLVNPGVVGTIDDIPAIVERAQVDRVVVSLTDARGKLPMDRLLEMKLAGVRFDHLPSVYEEYTGKIAVENLRPSWLIFSEGFRKAPWMTWGKRIGDIVAAGAGLVLSSPLILLSALAVKLTSRGPVFYHQERVGEHGRPFLIHKLRSMVQDAEAGTGPVWARGGDDPRVTPVGRFLRRTRLDELPQLWNVLLGEMSFVGPRPERPEFVEALTRQIPFYGQRHVVKPGLTGWAQVRYEYGATVEDALEKLQYDLFYIKNMSFGLDVYILLETVKTVLVRSGS